MIDASWIIENKQTGKPVLETYDFEMVQFVNPIQISGVAGFVLAV